MKQGALPVEEALDIASEIADGLAYAHAHGYVHRDVKPSNVLLSSNHALLSDFGIARALDAAASDNLTETGLALGTANYMSPEQAAGKHIDARSDIYSLGCVLYEMLAGTPPFTGSGPALLARHAMDAVPSLRTVRPSVTPALQRVIVKAMAKVPADRYANAEAFKKALHEAAKASPSFVSTNTWLRPRPLFVAATALLLVLIGLFVWPPAQALDANRVIVFPLMLPSDFNGPRSVGEDVATMIGNALDGAGSLRWIDGWTLLAPNQREDLRQLSHDAARTLARDKRSAFFVTGRLVARGDSADVFLTLNDVRGDSVIANGRASGLGADAWRLGLRAINEILPKLIPGSRTDVVREWTDRQPAAIASFLLGEAAFRRVNMSTALTHYRAAVAADSSFGLAAIRGAQAATWNHLSSESASLIQVATRHPLPRRYAGFARGYAAYIAGRADSAAAIFRQVITEDPEMAVAWSQLGEVYMHLLPKAGNPDSLAEAAFVEAHRLDPTAVNQLFHLIEIWLRKGDTARAGLMVQQFLASRPDSTHAAQVEIMYECIREGPRRMNWRSHATSRPLPTLMAAFSLAAAGSQLGCAEPAFVALIENDTAATNEASGRRWSALVGMQNVLLARGKFKEAEARIDSFTARWGFGSSLYLFDAPFVDAFKERANDIAHADAQRYGSHYETLPYVTRLWQLGLWSAHSGHPETAAAVARQLSDRALKTGVRRDALLARSLEAHTTLARRDTKRALQQFEALVPADVRGEDLKWDDAQPLGGERMNLARLLLANRQFRRAIEVASVFDSGSPSIYLFYLPASLRLRAAAADSLGDQRLRSHYQARLDQLEGGRTGNR